MKNIQKPPPIAVRLKCANGENVRSAFSRTGKWVIYKHSRNIWVAIEPTPENGFQPKKFWDNTYEDLAHRVRLEIAKDQA